MPLFRITKKLATALRIKQVALSVESTRPEYEWFADLFYVERKKCIIWVDRPTLFTFVRPAVVAAELREFHPLFRYEFRTAIASMALPESLIDHFGIYQPEAYAPTNERAVVGSMLDHRKIFKLWLTSKVGLSEPTFERLTRCLTKSPCLS
jgi:hypothetical protein